MKTKILKFYGKRSVWMRIRWTKLFEWERNQALLIGMRHTSWNIWQCAFVDIIQFGFKIKQCWKIDLEASTPIRLAAKEEEKDNSSKSVSWFEDVSMSKFQYWFDLHHANMYLILTFEKVATAFRWIWSIQISSENRNSIKTWKIDAKTLGSMSLEWSEKVRHLNSANEYLFLLNYSKLYKI